MGESGIRFLGLRVLGGHDVDHSNNSSDLAVIRQVPEDINNHNKDVGEKLQNLEEIIQDTEKSMVRKEVTK